METSKIKNNVVAVIEMLDERNTLLMNEIKEKEELMKTSKDKEKIKIARLIGEMGKTVDANIVAVEKLIEIVKGIEVNA